MSEAAPFVDHTRPQMEVAEIWWAVSICQQGSWLAADLDVVARWSGDSQPFMNVTVSTIEAVQSSMRASSGTGWAAMMTPGSFMVLTRTLASVQ